MQKRDDLEFRGNAIVGDISSDQNAGARQERHLGMTNLERLAARQSQLHRLKRTTREHFSKGLNGHAVDYSEIVGLLTMNCEAIETRRNLLPPIGRDKRKIGKFYRCESVFIGG